MFQEEIHLREPNKMTANTTSLNANEYDTDKKIHTHYLRNYEEYFARLVDKEVRLLELGIYHGGSLLLWRDYFQKGLIVGLDINHVTIKDAGERIRIYQGAQQDTDVLDRIGAETAPEGFDVIIDDCSHIGVLTRASFWHLFENHLKSGGLYVIEDWGTGYWDSWLDGVQYKRGFKGYSHPLYRLTRVIARAQGNNFFKKVPFMKSLLTWSKALVLKRQYASHDFGMVGFIKELIDECGMNDITHPQFGISPPRASQFKEMRITHSQALIVKA